MTARDWVRRNGSRAGLSALALIASYNAGTADHLSKEADRRVQQDLAAQARTTPARPAARPTAQAGPTEQARRHQAEAAKAREVDKQQIDNLRDIAEAYGKERERHRPPRPRPQGRSRT